MILEKKYASLTFFVSIINPRDETTLASTLKNSSWCLDSHFKPFQLAWLFVSVVGNTKESKSDFPAVVNSSSSFRVQPQLLQLSLYSEYPDPHHTLSWDRH